MGINRIKLQAGSSAEMAAAQKAKTSDPALDAIRQQLFGQDYIQDIGRGQGIAQYYSGFGLPSSLQFTQSATSTPTVDTSTPAVDTGGGGGAGITSASTVQPTTPVIGDRANTSFEQNLIDQGVGVQTEPGTVVAPGEMPVTQAEMDAFNKIPVSRTTLPSGDVFATDDPMLQEKIDYTQDPEGFGDRVKTALSEGKDLVTEFGQGVANQVTKLKDQGIDLGRLAGRAIANAIFPGLGFVLGALPERDPRQTELENLYDVKDGTIQSGLMKGYNPVSGGLLNTITGGAAGTPTTYGLQDAYDKRIGTIENTLKDKYNMTDAEIADVRAGSYTGDVDTNLLDRLTDLDEAKAKEKDRLDLFSGDVDDRDQMLENIVAQNKARELGLGVDTGIEGEEVDRFTASPVAGKDFGVEVGSNITGVNPFAGIDTGVGEFDIMGTEPTLQDVAAANNINISGGLPTYETLPEGASKTGTPVDALNPVNRQQHFDNTQKLKDAVREGKISNETYNRLSAFDARKTMGLGAVTGGIASGLYQGVQTAAGAGRELFGLNPAYAGDQSVKEAIDDTIRNIQGVSGNITPEEQVQYQEIVSGQDIYRDPILGMVEEAEVGTLAKDYGDAFKDYLDDISYTESGPDFGRTDGILDTLEPDRGGPPSVISRPDSSPPPSFTPRGGGADRDPAPAPKSTPSFTPRGGGADRDPAPARKETQQQAQQRTGGGSCFIAGTKVRMADGTDKNIENIVVGDMVKGQNGDNKVIALDPTLLADRKLYSFNDSEHYFFTSEHPFMTEEGWKSIKPEKTKERDGVELYDQLKGELKVGDKLVTENGLVEITDIKSKEMNNPEMPLYNFHVSNDNSYIADKHVVHNKGCFIAGTLITMADGTTKPVEKVDLGDKVAEGGKVFATGKFLINDLYDYKGIKVSGSHMVSEDGNWVRVEDSKHGKALGDDEHTVYVFGAENRKILINDILFTDYFEVNEQEKLSEGDKFFDNWKIHAKVDSDNNVNVLNAN